jgi:hypothetical protein
MTLETQPIDQIRVGLKLAQHYINRTQDEKAQAELKMLRELYPQDSQRFGVASQLVPTGTSNLPLPGGPLYIQMPGPVSNPGASSK